MSSKRTRPAKGLVRGDDPHMHTRILQGAALIFVGVRAASVKDIREASKVSRPCPAGQARADRDHAGHGLISRLLPPIQGGCPPMKEICGGERRGGSCVAAEASCSPSLSQRGHHLKGDSSSFPPRGDLRLSSSDTKVSFSDAMMATSSLAPNDLLSSSQDRRRLYKLNETTQHGTYIALSKRSSLPLHLDAHFGARSVLGGRRLPAGRRGRGRARRDRVGRRDRSDRSGGFTSCTLAYGAHKSAPTRTRS